MTPHELLSHLHDLNIYVSRNGDNLFLSAPPGVLTDSLKEQLAHRKQELLLLIDQIADGPHHDSVIVPIQPKGRRRAFFACPGHNGDVFCFLQLARHLGPDQPFYALQPPGINGKDICPGKLDELASLYVSELLAFQKHGPFLIGGFCLGGTIAFEVAQQLRACGRDIAFLVLLGAACPTSFSARNRMSVKLNHGVTRIVDHSRNIRRLSTGERLTYVTDMVRRRLSGGSLPARGAAPDQTPHQIAVGRTSVKAARYYRRRMQPYDGSITLFAPCRDWINAGDRPEDWRRFAKKGLTIFTGPDHSHVDRMLLEPDVRIFAGELRRRLDQLETKMEPTGGAPVAGPPLGRVAAPTL